MSDAVKPLQHYLYAMEKKLVLGDATEHTHRSALEGLIESLLPGTTSTNEPKHIECGRQILLSGKGRLPSATLRLRISAKALMRRRNQNSWSATVIPSPN